MLYSSKKRRFNRRLAARLLIVAAVGMLIFRLAAPYTANLSSISSATVLLDLSGSMQARGLKDASKEPLEENLTRTRLDDAKDCALELIDRLSEADIALVAFARRAYLISPITRHSPSLKEMVNALEIMAYEDGTAIGEALICAFKTLEHQTGNRIIYLITDGADHSDAASLQNALDLLKKNNIQIYPIIVGKEYIYHPVRDANGKETWQPKGEIPNVELLEKLAHETNGRLITLEQLRTQSSPAPKNPISAQNLLICAALCCIIIACIIG